MSPKEQISEELNKLALKVRSAYEEFNRATGLSVQAQAQWVSVDYIEQAGSTILLSGVTVESGSVGARA